MAESTPTSSLPQPPTSRTTGIQYARSVASHESLLNSLLNSLSLPTESILQTRYGAVVNRWMDGTLKTRRDTSPRSLSVFNVQTRSMTQLIHPWKMGWGWAKCDSHSEARDKTRNERKKARRGSESTFNSLVEDAAS